MPSTSIRLLPSTYMYQMDQRCCGLVVIVVRFPYADVDTMTRLRKCIKHVFVCACVCVWVCGGGGGGCDA